LAGRRDHLLCCGCGGEVIRRHNQLVWVIRQIAQQAGIRSSSTFRTIHNPNPQDSKNQVDIALFQPNFDPGDAGCTYLYDTTVIHPTAKSYIEVNKHDANHSLIHSAQQKRNKHQANAETQGKKFIPLAFSTFGNANEDVLRLISQLVERCSEKNSCHISVACQYISTYIDLTLLRQTVSIILNRFDTLLVEGTISDSPVLSQPEELRNPLDKYAIRNLGPLSDTSSPVSYPSLAPIANPTPYPTIDPTSYPTVTPSSNPTFAPTLYLTANPSPTPAPNNYDLTFVDIYQYIQGPMPRPT
jgi:hypothetical protein